MYNLQKKHRLPSNSELLLLQNDLSEKIQQAVFGDEAIEKLKLQIDAEQKELEEIAAQLSANRKKAIPEIESKVLNSLSEMGMNNAMLKI